MKGKDARLWVKETGETVQLDLDKPKVVHKFSVCIEHFAALTSAKHNLKVLGTITDDDAWAPVLSLGELMLIWRYLDSEISFFHYLTRRATLEDLLEFEGDEQDILSTYLINGLFIDPENLQGRQRNCSRRFFGCHAGMGSGLPSRVRRMASMARMQRRRAVSTTDRRSA